MASLPRQLRNLLPNLLTCLRIVLTPWISRAVLQGNCEFALPLSVFAGLTDVADGYVARKLHISSRTGAWLDPIADKILLTALYVSFAMADLVPDWLVWLVVGRDVLILCMAAAGLALTSIRDFPPTVWGKISTVVQITGSLILLCSCADYVFASAIVPVVIGTVAVATGWSGIHYIWRAIAMLRFDASAGRR